jgi:hypothetical protein
MAKKPLARQKSHFLPGYDPASQAERLHLNNTGVL